MAIGSIAAGLGSSALGGFLGGGQSPTITSSYTPYLTNISGGGLFDTSFGQGGANIALSPEMQAIQQGLFAQAGGANQFQQQAGELSAGYLGQAGTYDPWQAAEQQFLRMEEILAPQREQSRQAQEARLYSQGRLGSTGGSLEQQAFQRAVEDQQSQNLYNAFTQAQDVENQLVNRGAFLGQIPLQQQTQSLQNLLGIQGAGVQQLQAGTFGGGVATQSTQQPSIGSQIGTGLLQGGMSQIGQGVGGLFQPQTQQQQFLEQQWNPSWGTF